MSKKKAEYTLWTIPISEWTPVLDGLQLTEENKQDLIKIAEHLDESRLDDRLRPFSTPVTDATLSKVVGQK